MLQYTQEKILKIRCVIMDLRKQIKTVISELPDTEKMIAVSVLIDSLIEQAAGIRKDLRIIQEIPISKIDPCEIHPFYVNDDENMMDLVKSIMTYGMLTPGAVRAKEDGRYELLSGHRRLRACQLAGMKSFSCEVLSLTDKEALLFMLEANRQRVRLCPGEKILAYSMKEKSLSDSIMDRDERSIRLDAEDTMKKIHKLEHLEYLIPELVEMLDNNDMSLSPAYELSFLPIKYQKVVWDCIDYMESFPSHAQAFRMRKMYEEGKLTPELIEKIMEELKPNQRERLILRNKDTLAQIPAEIPESRREEYVAMALRLVKKMRRQ